MSTYQRMVAERLTQVHKNNSTAETRELASLRLILFSDLHKGRRDGADDFEQCEVVYLAALDHYWAERFDLYLLGDVEELWENSPRPVISAYQNVLVAEKAFAATGDPPRYRRLMGNHDDLWYDSDAVARHLGPYLSGSPVVEAIRLRVQEQGQDLGELFLVHGHQGTLDSERYGAISQWLVRTFWRPIQRLFRIKSSTPSNDFRLRQEHEVAMYAWAAGQDGRVLIAGHTHHPVWEGLSFQQALEKEISVRGVERSEDRRWIAEQVEGRVELPGDKPSYFNTGCCSFSDGSITGLEIAEGQIRLVRWHNGDQPLRQVLFSAGLAEVLRAVAPP